jgi:hypothetical protein
MVVLVDQDHRYRPVRRDLSDLIASSSGEESWDRVNRDRDHDRGPLGRDDPRHDLAHLGLRIGDHEGIRGVRGGTPRAP